MNDATVLLDSLASVVLQRQRWPIHEDDALARKTGPHAGTGTNETHCVDGCGHGSTPRRRHAADPVATRNQFGHVRAAATISATIQYDRAQTHQAAKGMTAARRHSDAGWGRGRVRMIAPKLASGMVSSDARQRDVRASCERYEPSPTRESAGEYLRYVQLPTAVRLETSTVHEHVRQRQALSDEVT